MMPSLLAAVLISSSVPQKQSIDLKNPKSLMFFVDQKGSALINSLGEPQSASPINNGPSLSFLLFPAKTLSQGRVATLEAGFDRLFPGRDSRTNQVFSSAQVWATIGPSKLRQGSPSLFVDFDATEAPSVVQNIGVKYSYTSMSSSQNGQAKSANSRARLSWGKTKNALGFQGDYFFHARQARKPEVFGGTTTTKETDKLYAGFYHFPIFAIGNINEGNEVVVTLEDPDHLTPMAFFRQGNKADSDTGLSEYFSEVQLAEKVDIDRLSVVEIVFRSKARIPYAMHPATSNRGYLLYSWKDAVQKNASGSFRSLDGVAIYK